VLEVSSNGTRPLLDHLIEYNDHWLVRPGHDEPAARKAAWEASGKGIKPGREPTPLCGLPRCVRPDHQLLWTPGKAIPPAVRSVFFTRLQQQVERPAPKELPTSERPHPIQDIETDDITQDSSEPE
jgi:hypothetical protein